MESSQDGVIITFENNEHGLTANEFAPKLIGKTKSGKLQYGYTRVPWITYKEGILSARKPILKVEGDKQEMLIQVDNFGEVKSKDAVLELYIGKGDAYNLLSKERLSALLPYASTKVTIPGNSSLKKGQKYAMKIVIKENEIEKSVFNFDLKVD
jgi:hypothetical protein